jgi:hypothetical protein
MANAYLAGHRDVRRENGAVTDLSIVIDNRIGQQHNLISQPGAATDHGTRIYNDSGTQSAERGDCSSWMDGARQSANRNAGSLQKAVALPEVRGTTEGIYKARVRPSGRCREWPKHRQAGNTRPPLLLIIVQEPQALLWPAGAALLKKPFRNVSARPARTED